MKPIRNLIEGVALMASLMLVALMFWASEAAAEPIQQATTPWVISCQAPGCSASAQGPTAAGSGAVTPPVIVGGTQDGSAGGAVRNLMVDASGFAHIVCASGCSASTGVFGPTANGSPAANPPVLIGGTQDGTATGTVRNWKIDSSGNGQVQLVGTLPAFASTPAVTLTGALPAFGSTPAFSISGTLPAFASTPTVNCGTGCYGQTAVTTSDKGGTITTGGTAQTAIASNASRKAFCLENDPASTETLNWRLNGTASATAGVPLLPGASYCSGGGFIDTSAVSVFAATTGHRWFAWEQQ